jgi:hypothetical protein
MLGAKCGTLHTDTFRCVVSTAKEGLFQKQSTMIIAGDMVQDRSNCRPCGKIVYAASLASSDRLQFHDIICKLLDESGENGLSLGESLDNVFAELKRRGVVTETINLAM